MIVTKSQYEIGFDEESHTYVVNGKRRPCVSDIIKAERLAKYWNLDPWYMMRGKQVHRATHLLDLNQLDWDTVSEDINGFVLAYLKFKEEMKMTFDHAEEPLYHSVLHYCGTPDRWLPLLDIKCGEGHTIQLEFYAELLRVNGVDPGARAYTLNLFEDETYRLTPYRLNHYERRIAMEAAHLVRYRIERKLQ